MLIANFPFPTMRPTMRDVAELAGVSQVTVTNVLRGREARTSSATRERVLRAVHKLGYTPVAQPASQQRHVETKVIGVTFDQIDALQDQLGLIILQGLREGAARHGYDLLLMLRPAPDWAPNREEVLFLDRRSDGFIFVAPLHRHKVLRALVKHRIPVVSCSSSDVPPGVAAVHADNFDEVHQAVRHLKQCGHSRILHIAGPTWNFDERMRGESFAPAMKAEGLAKYSDWILRGPDAKPWLEPSVTFAEVKRRKATAVVCCNDGVAIELWKCAQQNGCKVPRDLSIIGINDTTAATQFGLTSVNMGLANMGVEAVESWIALQQGASYKTQNKKTPVQLISRASVAPPRRSTR